VEYFLKVGRKRASAGHEAQMFFSYRMQQGFAGYMNMKKKNLHQSFKPSKRPPQADKPNKGGCLSRFRRSRIDEFTRKPAAGAG
jgi:hypothetical protein